MLPPDQTACCKPGCKPAAVQASETPQHDAKLFGILDLVLAYRNMRRILRCNTLPQQIPNASHNLMCEIVTGGYS